MFSRRLKSPSELVRIKLVTSDRAVGEHFRSQLATERNCAVELMQRTVVEAATAPETGGKCAVLVVDVDPRNSADITALERILSAESTTVPVIVVSEDLGSDSVRRLLHLKIADWLPRHADPQDLLKACMRAISANQTNGRTPDAKVYAFYPAMGGVGSTTLAAASASVLAQTKRQTNSVCLIDLDLQSGMLAEYLDLPANLQFEDRAISPERLDAHLLEVLLSRHASGLALLAAPNSLTGFAAASPELVTRLLDLASVKFDNLIVDLPRTWLPWSESVLRAADHFYVVTDLSVPGLRQARRVVDEFNSRFDVPSKGRVIVNKIGWLGNHGVKKNDAYEALGERLAGFVSEADALVNESRNRGVPLSEVKAGNRVEKDLAAIFKAA